MCPLCVSVCERGNTDARAWQLGRTGDTEEAALLLVLFVVRLRLPAAHGAGLPLALERGHLRRHHGIQVLQRLCAHHKIDQVAVQRFQVPRVGGNREGLMVSVRRGAMG